MQEYMHESTKKTQKCVTSIYAYPIQANHRLSSRFAKQSLYHSDKFRLAPKNIYYEIASTSFPALLTFKSVTNIRSPSNSIKQCFLEIILDTTLMSALSSRPERNIIFALSFHCYIQLFIYR